MDTSEEMKEMCRTANLEWTPMVGMWVIDVWIGDAVLICGVDENRISLTRKTATGRENIYVNDKSKLHPLWQQDQLQAMVNDNYQEHHKLIYEFSINKTPWAVNSYEKLELAYVMHKNFNKLWDAERKEWKENE